MKHVLARGYNKKSKDIAKNESVTNRFAAYEGELRFDNKSKYLYEYFKDKEKMYLILIIIIMKFNFMYN